MKKKKYINVFCYIHELLNCELLKQGEVMITRQSNS